METKLREVTIEEYWTSIVKGTAEFGEIAVAENPEFNNLAKCIYQALCDGFIDEDMSEYGVSRWEHILGITPVAGSSLDDRKAAILTHLSVKIPYTWRVLKQMLIPIIGSEDKFEMSLNNEMGELDIKFKMPASETPIDAVKQLMERVLPMNLVTVYDYDIETLVKILNDGLAEMLGEGNFVLEYISDEKMVVVHTDRVDELTIVAVENLLGRVLPQNIEVAQYNHNMEISWRDITVHVPPSEVNKYDNCINISEVAAVNADYKSDLVNGGWGYPLTALRSAQSSDSWSNSGLFRGASMTRFGIPILPNLVMARGMFYACGQLTEIKLRMPKVAHIGAQWEANTGYPLGFLGNCKKLNWAELYTPECIGAVGAFRGDTVLTSVNLVSSKKLTYATEICADCPALTSFAWEASDIHTATGGWRGCQLNKDSVLGIVAALAASPYKNQSGEQAGLITLGIHIDHQNDEEVLAAITNAESKGWTLTVQWNGTPTAQASTFGMRLIYARVNEYELPDGTTERVLDWGHYVTNPEEYETFRSLESAYRYFNLEMPEYE